MLANFRHNLSIFLDGTNWLLQDGATPNSGCEKEIGSNFGISSLSFYDVEAEM